MTAPDTNRVDRRGLRAVLASVMLAALLLQARGPLVSPVAAQQPAVIVGAGDVAVCGALDGAEATAKLLDAIEGTVVTLGDNAYQDGSSDQFRDCYDPSWGRHKGRTRPAVGNHEYQTPGATGYFEYFGSAAGDPDKGYYSYDLGSWHIVVVNSNCWMVPGACDRALHEAWLRADLDAHPAACTLAYWHHPRFSSGDLHGNAEPMRPAWQILYDHGADVVLSGHSHNYERFAPLDPEGNADPERGIRQFVVGTGGTPGWHEFGAPLANGSEALDTGTFGVLKLVLADASYSWEFVPIEGQTFTDRPSDSDRTTCHHAP